MIKDIFICVSNSLDELKNTVQVIDFQEAAMYNSYSAFELISNTLVNINQHISSVDSYINTFSISNKDLYSKINNLTDIIKVNNNCTQETRLAVNEQIVQIESLTHLSKDLKTSVESLNNTIDKFVI